MTLKGEPEFFPRMTGQQADVMPGSPLAVLAMLTEIVRERFREANKLAWYWHENSTPGADETNDPDAPRKILIEPSFAENEETRNFRPAIIVDKGETVPSKVSIGNFAGQQIHTGLRGFYSLSQIPIDITVKTDRSGESATLADILWFYLLAGREQICSTFGLQDMTNPVLGRTSPVESDRREWHTHISFQISIGLRWSTLPISPILREIVTRYRASGETDLDTYLLKSFIR